MIKEEMTAARMERTVIVATILQRIRTPASHLVKVRWSLANDWSALCIRSYRRSAIAMATKLAATCAMDPIVAM